jgi:hypothetical protein
LIQKSNPKQTEQKTQKNRLLLRAQRLIILPYLTRKHFLLKKHYADGNKNQKTVFNIAK